MSTLSPDPSTLALTLLLLLTGLTTSIPVHAAPNLRCRWTSAATLCCSATPLAMSAPPARQPRWRAAWATAEPAPPTRRQMCSGAPILPTEGEAEANTGITAAQARSTAMLSLPAGAQVTHAYLYWAALTNAASGDTTATIDRPGAGGFSQPVTALESLLVSGRYRSVTDVTTLVQANGAGAYRVSDVDIGDWVNVNNPNVFGAWWMVVLYQRDSDPLRNLTIYDGFDGVSSATPQNITLSGFRVPSGPIDAKLGIVTLEGITQAPVTQSPSTPPRCSMGRTRPTTSSTAPAATWALPCRWRATCRSWMARPRACRASTSMLWMSRPT